MSFGGGGDSSVKAAKEDAAARQQAIDRGLSNIAGAYAPFDEAFYQKRAQDYLDYAAPTLATQAQRARGQITAGLGDRGLAQSSAAQKSWADFDTDYATQQRNIANTAQDEANKLRQNVEASRSNITNTLYATAAPDTATQSALTAATSFQAPSAWQPVGDLFSSYANAYNIYRNQRANTELGNVYKQAMDQSRLPSNTSVGGY